jgi:hypothetical protein
MSSAFCRLFPCVLLGPVVEYWRKKGGNVKNNWKVVGVVFIIISVVALAAAVFLGVKYLDVTGSRPGQPGGFGQFPSGADGPQLRPGGDEASRGTDLAITEWDVSITVPKSLTDVHYVVNGDNAFFVARSASVDLTYATGVLDNIPQYALATLTRATSDANSEYSQSTVKLGDYYYLTTGAQGVTELYGATEADHRVEAIVRDMVVEMLGAARI